jgi:hypothetical protein
METIKKIDETTFKKTTPQSDLVETKTLDNLLQEKKVTESDIQGHTDEIFRLNIKLEKINADIVKVKSLGILTAVEVAPKEKEPQPVELPVEIIKP